MTVRIFDSESYKGISKQIYMHSRGRFLSAVICVQTDICNQNYTGRGYYFWNLTFLNQ